MVAFMLGQCRSKWRNFANFSARTRWKITWKMPNQRVRIKAWNSLLGTNILPADRVFCRFRRLQSWRQVDIVLLLFAHIVHILTGDWKLAGHASFSHTYIVHTVRYDSRVALHRIAYRSIEKSRECANNGSTIPRVCREWRCATRASPETTKFAMQFSHSDQSRGGFRENRASRDRLSTSVWK